ncbi:hypothetical protein MSG28_006123 [Choristoneura fumiferana]|uniref:Uncharacterized protein n=1 Tax=Choristoneura fumiferana TaxID=7141 RepID=A0ACC0JDQ8_CHOFU|nr:hypothetical protein MSG28_006123 [Choristoneura fumiferana]
MYAPPQARPPRAHPPPRSVALPALVRPRHYPCGACPKMYAPPQARPPRAHPPPRSVALPALVRPRHYPCGACPKMYRAAAKRDRHVRTHHPGAVGGGAIEGGRRACPPAACPACPRQNENSLAGRRNYYVRASGECTHSVLHRESRLTVMAARRGRRGPFSRPGPPRPDLRQSVTSRRSFP